MAVAIVIGGAREAWDELDRARALAPAARLIATNHAGRDFPGHVPHWVTMHPELLPLWVRARTVAGRPPAGDYWTATHRKPLFPGINTLDSKGGSSGMLAVLVAFHLGFDRVILAGVPMSQNGRHYDDDRKWFEARQYLAAWHRQLPLLTGRVKSFSGETAKLLGTPCGEWLDGDGARG